MTETVDVSKLISDEPEGGKRVLGNEGLIFAQTERSQNPKTKEELDGEINIELNVEDNEDEEEEELKANIPGAIVSDNITSNQDEHNDSSDMDDDSEIEAEIVKKPSVFISPLKNINKKFQKFAVKKKFEDTFHADWNNLESSDQLDKIRAFRNLDIKTIHEMDRKNPITMNYHDSKLENEFVKFYYSTDKESYIHYFRRFKIALFVATLLWTCFIAVDVVASKEKLERYILGIVLRVIMLPIAALYITSIFIPKIIKHFKIVEIAGAFVIMLYVVITCIKAASYTFDSPSYPIGTMVVCLVSYQLPRPRVKLTYPIGILSVVSYIGFHAIFNYQILILNTDQTISRNKLILFIVGIIFIQIIGITQIYILERYFRKLFLLQKQLTTRNQQMQIESKRQHLLLENILPKEYVKSVKDDNLRFVKEYREVTVVSSDIVQFTLFCSKTQASEVVKMLNAHFSLFDRLATKYNQEKIKTIGDAYFCVGGLFNEENKFINAVNMGLAMLAAVQRVNEIRKLELNIRVGVSCGPAIVGVIGKHKITFDAWGAAVKESQVMESSGKPGFLQVTQRVRTESGAQFNFMQHMTDEQGNPTFLVISRNGTSKHVLTEPTPSNSKPMSPIPTLEEKGMTIDTETKGNIDDLDLPTTGMEAEVMDSSDEYHDDTPYIFQDRVEYDEDTLSVESNRSITSMRTGHHKNIQNSRAYKDFLIIQKFKAISGLIILFKPRVFLDYMIRSYSDMILNIRITLISSCLAYLLILGNILVLDYRLYASIPIIIQYASLGVQVIITLLYILVEMIASIRHRVQKKKSKTPADVPTPETSMKERYWMLLRLVFGAFCILMTTITTVLSCCSIMMNQFMVVEFLGLCGMWTQLSFHMFPLIPLVFKIIVSGAFLVAYLLTAFFIYEPHNSTHPYFQLTDFGLIASNLAATFLFMCVVSFILEKSSIRAYMTLRSVEYEINQIGVEQRRNKHLILSVLPESVLDRIVNQQEPEKESQNIIVQTDMMAESSNIIADKIENGSVMFIGISGFEDECDVHHNTTVAIEVLNDIFNAYDILTEAVHTCYKIKSIGSTYLVVSGLHDMEPLKADMLEGNEKFIYYNNQLALLSLKVKASTTKILQANQSRLKAKWHFKIGINTGDFVAGVLGTSKFLYDVFADAVNLSARLYQTGAKNEIHFADGITHHCMSKAPVAYYPFRYEERGHITMKGKGDVMTYILNTQKGGELLAKPVSYSVAPSPSISPMNHFSNMDQDDLIQDATNNVVAASPDEQNHEDDQAPMHDDQQEVHDEEVHDEEAQDE